MRRRILTRYILRRVAFIIPQLLVVTVVSFLLLKLIPGDPVRQILGPAATNEVAVAAARDRLGLDEPVVVQYWKYLSHTVQGDWGKSFRTQEPVLNDIAVRLPATLELITLATIISVVLGIGIGMIAGLRPTGLVNRFLSWYGFFAGSIPDFWMGLLLIFFFFSLWHVVPAPLGQLAIDIRPPPIRTHWLPLDALLAGDWNAFQSAVVHLILPVATLVLVYMPAVLKTVAASVDKHKDASFVRAARLHGMKRRYVYWYIFRNALPPVITVMGVLYAFLLGGSVLVEQVFAWNGFGQYSVESVLRKDLFPIQGFMVLAAAFTMLNYLVVDILYAIADPRVRL